MPQTNSLPSKMVGHSGGAKRASRTSNRAVTIPLDTMKHANCIDPKERLFLDAAEKGDKHTMMRLLQGSNPVNVNCTNMLGRSAIQIAVDNENTEIVELLLKEDGVRIGDALLYAIREGVYRIVEMIIEHPTIQRDMLGTEWSKTRHMDEESFDYSPDISPVILAAHCNQFEILQLLLLHGATIDRPHQLSCSCKRCQAQVHADSLRHSLLRINTYRALASPAWISLTSPDPVLAAFKLSWELEKLALRENEFKDSYLQLGHQVKKYACDLLGQCRSSEEVIAVLNKTNDSDAEDEEEQDGDKLTLSRLKLALKYEQKQFVAHPHCQQLLTSIWYEGLPGWRKRNGFTKFLICTGLILLLPFMSVYYWIFPRSKIGQLLRSPFMKFLYHSASFGVFLFLLVCASTDISNAPRREMFRGPAPSELEWLIVLWVTGFIWGECKQLWEEGLRAYIRQWWNWLDFIMLSLYLATFSLRFVAYLQIESGLYGPREMARKDWPTNDPTLISEGLFAVANIFSFARIIFLFQANQHLGPLQISLGCMLIDIVKFLFIFFLVLTSFACGLNQLYYYYKPTQTDENDSFFTLGASYMTLFWSMFSLTPPKEIEIKDGHNFTMMIGEFMFMAYHGMAIIVLLNMLIAMMSSSFQDIENHCDMEWKFSRSKLWIGYFDEGSTLPPPFNLFISPKSIYYLYCRFKRCLCSCFYRNQTSDGSHRKISEGTIRSRRTVEPSDNYIFKTDESGNGISFDASPHVRPTYNGDVQSKHYPCRKDTLQYQAGKMFLSILSEQENVWPTVESRTQEVMRRLVSRCIHQYKKEGRQDGVNEDDLLEIKQDISSLRYELREDRKKEALNLQSAINFDGVRKDMLHMLHSASPNTSPHIPHSRSSPNNMASFNAGLSQQDMDYLKYDIVKTLKAEMRETIYGCFSNLANQQAVATLTPPVDADLYQTHLYTQL